MQNIFSVLSRQTTKTATALSILFLTLLIQAASAQSKFQELGRKIDSLASIGLPKSALAEVDKLDALAKASKNSPQQIRAVIYRMLFQSYLEDDALAQVISGLKADIDQSRFPVKPVLQSLLADTYWKYYQQNRYQFSLRSRLTVPDNDFKKWDLQTIVNETNNLYRHSLADTKRLQNTPVGVLDGVLEGDSTTRYLRPTLYDLLVQRALAHHLSAESELIKPRQPFVLDNPGLFGDSKTFVKLKINTADTTSAHYLGIKYLQQATTFHLNHNHAEALADLDLQRLKFLYDKATVPGKDSLYLGALAQIANTFALKPISADALVLQGQYYEALDSLKTAYAFFKQAATNYPESLGGKNASVFMQQLAAKSLSVIVEKTNVPNKSILALLKYRNTNTAKLAIYHLSSKQYEAYAEENRSAPYEDRNKQKLNYLKNHKPIQTREYKWAEHVDYREHSSEVKIDPLKAGNYVLVVDDGHSNNEHLVTITEFCVSGLSYSARMNPDGKKELRVMNRETGSPMAGVSVRLEEKHWYRGNGNHKPEMEPNAQTGLTNKEGFYASDKMVNESMSVTLIHKGDTLINQSSYFAGPRERIDDIEDKTILFTDRQIYRPGQTIHFKGLQVEIENGKSKIMPNEEIEVEFSDVNNKTVSSLALKTNEFGTFSGSFIIPQSMLAGEVTLETDDGVISFRVEEYKRPTFEVAFLPVKESHKLNDSVTVSGNVRAFSGYGISNASVAFRIVRTETMLFSNEAYGMALYGSRYVKPEITEIKSDTISSDAQGNFNITFKAIPDLANNSLLSTYIYTINADITDASGETRSGQTTITIGNNDMVIIDNLPKQLFAKHPLNGIINVNNLNGQSQKATVKVEIFALRHPDRVFKARLWAVPDRFILDSTTFKENFPEYPYKQEDLFPKWPIGDRIVNIETKTDGKNPAVVSLESLKKHRSGVYKIVISARNEKGDTSSTTNYINYIATPDKPANMHSWLIPVSTEVRSGDNAEFLLGIDEPINVLMERYHGTKLISSKWLTIKKGQQSIKVPIGATDEDVVVQFLMVHQNRLYTSYQTIRILDNDESLKLKLLTFRDKLAPGQKEQWKLQVSNSSNEKQMAELLAGLYDASLDKITGPANWETLLNTSERYNRNYFIWSNFDFVSIASSLFQEYRSPNYSPFTRDYEKLNMFGYEYYGGHNSGYRSYLQRAKKKLADGEIDRQLEQKYHENAKKVKEGYDITGKVVEEGASSLAGIHITIKGTKITTMTNSKGRFKIKVPLKGVLVFSYVGLETKEYSTTQKEDITMVLKGDPSSLNEVVVAAYGMEKKQSSTAAVIQIRGVSSLPVSPLAPLGTDPQGTADSDARPEQLLVAANPKVAYRTDFNETAFFYPQLRTDDKGQILIEFTIPESLTRWKFRALAHTKDLNVGYIEADVFTQKQLSINANMPRFLREGDTITVSARLANLTTNVLKGKAKLQLFNGVTMQPVKLLHNTKDAEQSFEVNASANKAISFKLIIPQNLEALTYRLSAEAGDYTDGEENTIPVLPNRTLVTEAVPMMVRAGQTRSFTFDKLLNNNSPTLQNKTFTLEYTQNPTWNVVQALPYMMEFPYECSEQLFSRYYANSLATKLVNSMPVIKQVFDRWKSTNSTELLSNLEKNQELKYTLLEETPWLRDAVGEAEQKKRLALLFDLNNMSNELKLNLEKLKQKQLSDGGFPWFGGAGADRYITQHILAGIGQLHRLNITEDQALRDIANKAVGYLDYTLVDDEERAKREKKHASQSINPIEIHAWYARSYFTDRPMSAALKAAFNSFLGRAEKQWILQNVYEQGMIALIFKRNGNTTLPNALIKSLKETAKQSDDMGMYWSKNQRGYYWYQSPVETQSLMIELFNEAGNDAKAIEEMKIWLLRNKQTNNWKTTKATAAACYALLNKQGDWLAGSNTTEIKLGGTPLTVLKPEVKAEAGTGYIKTTWADEQIQPTYGKAEVSNIGKTVSWGAMYWQYLEQLDKITPSKTDIQLERKYFIMQQTDRGPVAKAVDATHQPKTGDLLKVIVYLKAGRDFEYVQLKDMRPAGTEPINSLSEYKYQDGLYYYQVTKDVATNFFISHLRKGNYVFEYQLRVAQPGNFSTGIATVQCMYAPEFNAHSEGIRMEIRP